MSCSCPVSPHGYATLFSLSEFNQKEKKKTPKKEEYKEIVFHKQINKSNVKTTCDPAYLSPKTA